MGNLMQTLKQLWAITGRLVGGLLLVLGAWLAVLSLTFILESLGI
jgi:hypothetical protein